MKILLLLKAKKGSKSPLKKVKKLNKKGKMVTVWVKANPTPKKKPKAKSAGKPIAPKKKKKPANLKPAPKRGVVKNKQPKKVKPSKVEQHLRENFPDDAPTQHTGPLKSELLGRFIHPKMRHVGEELTVTESGDKEYPYRVTNTSPYLNQHSHIDDLSENQLVKFMQGYVPAKTNTKDKRDKK